MNTKNFYEIQVCPDCEGKGWYESIDDKGEIEHHQCSWCYENLSYTKFKKLTERYNKSIFNTNNAIDFILS